MTDSDSPSQPQHFISAAKTRRARNRGAASRPQIAYFENEIGARLLERLTYIKHQPRTILNMGCGLARHSEQLAKIYPDATIVQLDSALEILKLPAPKSLSQKLRALFKTRSARICAEPTALPLAPQTVDMVWVNLLNVASAAPVIIAEFKRVLKSGGLLMLATVGPDTLQELRVAFALVDALPHVQPQIDMHDLGDMLVHEGFVTPVVDMEMLTLTYPNLNTLAHDLRAAGATNLIAGRRATLTGKGRWTRVERAYELQRNSGQLPASVEVIYLHAWRGVERKTSDGRQIIRFDKTQ
ncbi:MAG: methyltransferase domain-containing protein [Burkholderiales bacterium]